MDALVKFAATSTSVAFGFYVTVIGFILTIFVFLRTKKISKILKHNSIAEKYNCERKLYCAKFSGHSSSIIKDDVHDRALISSIHYDLTSFREKFRPVLPINKRIQYFYLSHYLSKDHSKINFHKVTVNLTKICGYLEKEEEINHGQ